MTLVEKYAQCLEPLGYGHALYQPWSTTDVKPGTVGFFKDDGTWTSIVNILPDDDDPIDPKLPPVKFKKSDLQKISIGRWPSPQISEGVSKLYSKVK